MADNDYTVRKDPFIEELLRKIPADIAKTFTDDQLAALKISLGTKEWKTHKVDLRGVFRFWRWRYYYVFLLGKERRSLSQRQRRALRNAEVYFITAMLFALSLFTLLVAYLVKSAAGINFLPEFSFGIWDWFKGL